MIDYTKIWEQAVEAGHKALVEAKPTPVDWVESDIFDNVEPGAKTYHVEEGLCGGAYLIIPGRGDFALFAKAKLGADRNYPKGLHLSCFDAHKGYRGQSAERYEACANAMAEVLKSNGIECRVRAYLT